MCTVVIINLFGHCSHSNVFVTSLLEPHKSDDLYVEHGSSTFVDHMLL